MALDEGDQRVHVNLEYIAVGFMIFMILVVVQTNIFGVTTHIITGFEHSESYKKAANILDVLLLSPGVPSNWWDYETYPHPNNISYIGLALEGSTEEYVLDIKKIQRLNPDSAGYIPPTSVRSLLGLRSYYDYSLRIMPIFNISISNVTGNFNIKVQDLNDLGLPNTNVTAFYVPSSIQAGVDYNSSSQLTEKDGSCNISFDYNPEFGIVVCVSHIGVKVLASKPENLFIRVLDDQVFEATYALISYLEYKTASRSLFTHTEIILRYVKIEGVSYYVEFMLWE